MPFSLSFFVLILTTHVLKGSATSIGGFPIFLIAFIVGIPIAALLHFVVLPKGGSAVSDGMAGMAAKLSGLEGIGGGDGSAGQSLLAGAVPVEGGAGKGAGDATAVQHAHHGGHHRKPWYKRLGSYLGGSNREPVPRGPVFSALLLLSFVMSLFWLLVIANEIVGTALCFGKVLGVPDVVMGLTVLAIGLVALSPALAANAAPRNAVLCHPVACLAQQFDQRSRCDHNHSERGLPDDGGRGCLRGTDVQHLSRCVAGAGRRIPSYHACIGMLSSTIYELLPVVELLVARRELTQVLAFRCLSTRRSRGLITSEYRPLSSGHPQ